MDPGLPGLLLGSLWDNYMKRKAARQEGWPGALQGGKALCWKANVMGIQVSEFPYEKRSFPSLAYLICDVCTL